MPIMSMPLFKAGLIIGACVATTGCETTIVTYERPYAVLHHEPAYREVVVVRETSHVEIAVRPMIIVAPFRPYHYAPPRMYVHPPAYGHR